MIEAPDPADIDDLPSDVLALLQRGMAQHPQGVRRQTLALRAVMAQHRSDLAGAELLSGIARSQAPASSPLYRALVKFYSRECQFDAAYDAVATRPPPSKFWSAWLDPSDGIGSSVVAAGI